VDNLSNMCGIETACRRLLVRFMLDYLDASFGILDGQHYSPATAMVVFTGAGGMVVY
jgi:hypothetical protein